MLFLNRAKVVCCLAGVLCFANSVLVKRTPIVAVLLLSAVRASG